MKILVTGAAGMLAEALTSELVKSKFQLVLTDINLRQPDIIKLDITDLKELFNKANEHHPDYIFHLAAETDVDLCEKNPDHAFLVNTVGTENVTLVCQELGLPLVYISTAGVFYGDKPIPYTEFDPPRPINIYGESKLQGELIVRTLLSRYFIIRAGWMIGGWEIDKKFVYKIIKQIKEGKVELRVVVDKFGSPTFTKDFAGNIMNVINTKRYGLYHMANKGTCSRYQLALKIVEFMGASDKIKVVPISSSEFPLPATRANSEMIRNYKLDLMGLNSMPNWKESLKKYIDLNRDK